jgi:hypothetical protein
MNQPFSTFFMLLQATRHWRELSPDDQRAAFDDALDHVFNRYPGLRMSHFAVSAGTRCSHLVVWEADDPAQFQEAIASLGDQPFFGAPLFETVEVIAASAGEMTQDDPPAAALAMLAL